MNTHNVYLLKITYARKESKIEVVYKIGVTKFLDKRIKSFYRTDQPSKWAKCSEVTIKDIKLLAYIPFEDMNEAYSFEKRILWYHRGIKYKGKHILPSGNSELIKEQVTFPYFNGRTVYFN